MELSDLIKLGDKLLVRIKFFEDAQIEALEWQGDLAFKWIALMNALGVFKRKSVCLPGFDEIAIMKYTEEKELVVRADSTIHRILLNPTMLLLICRYEDVAYVTERKTDLALLLQAFNEVIPEMVKDLGKVFDKYQNA
jgi:hypothetical protein